MHLITFGLLFVLSCVNNGAITADFSPTGARLTPIASNIGSNQFPANLERIKGTPNFRMNGKKDNDTKFFDVRDIRHIHCVRPGKCEKLKNTTCFGSKLPYTYSSLDLTDSNNQEQTRERLFNYEALRNIPKCWAVIQPFLCAVFVPKCERMGDHDMVFLPSLEMCRITSEPCRLLYNTTFFPEFLKCNETLFPSKCNNDVREMKFNATGQCLSPLVATDLSASYYPDIEGCGVQCLDPLYTDDEHRQIHKLIGWGATLCFFSNLFVVITFIIDWQNANKYPAVIVFYINLCFLVSCLGWLAQFSTGSREDIVCRKEGTLRHSEPSAGENLSCITVFVLVYYCTIGAMVWFVIFLYVCYLSAIGVAQDRIDKKGSYFHLIAWSLPLVLTITIMALSEVDANSIVGICFVGYINHPMRAGFLIGPLAGVFIIGGFCFVRAMIMLFDLQTFANDIKSSSASNKIHLIIVRMGLSTMFKFGCIVVACICQVYQFRHSHLWADSLQEYIICKISSTYTDMHRACKLDSRPSVAILQLELLCLFASGIVMSSWCWTSSSLDTWRRYIKKKFGHDVNEDIKIQKHKVIAQTWAKRKEFQDKGRLSISFYNTHTDPVGLNFNVNDLNSTGTNDISSTWANYLPNVVKRRFALTGAATNSSSCGPRKSSLDSNKISISVKRVSVESISRRNSVDSQVSLKISEMQTKVARRTTSGGHHHHHHHTVKGKTTAAARNRRRDFHHTSSTANHRFNRRESSTSVESQVITAAVKKTSYPQSNKISSFFPTKDPTCMKRRSASAGIVDADDINTFLTNGKLILPFLHNQGMTTTSDDDNISRTSVKVQDSRLNVVVRNRDRHISDDDDNDDDDDDDDNDDEQIMRHCTNYQQKYIQTNHITTDDKSFGYPSLQEILAKTCSGSSSVNGTTTEIKHNNALKNSGGGGGRNSKNSLKSIRSRKSSRQSTRRNRINSSKNMQPPPKIVTKKDSATTTEMTADDSSFASFSSGLEIPNGGAGGGGNVQSSYSGLSVCKTHSRGSKTSCDVGIQANAYEIATQTMSFDGTDHNNLQHHRDSMRTAAGMKVSNDHRNDDDDDDDDAFNDGIGENHQLLPTSAPVTIRKREQSIGTTTTSMIRRDTLAMSESEKLKMLLLPSK